VVVVGGQWGGTRVGRCPSKLPWLQYPPQAAGRATEGLHPGFQQHRLGQTERVAARLGFKLLEGATQASPTVAPLHKQRG
jgi:hypothetical protein